MEDQEKENISPPWNSTIFFPTSNILFVTWNLGMNSLENQENIFPVALNSVRKTQ
jgi:hypothetical protein